MGPRDEDELVVAGEKVVGDCLADSYGNGLVGKFFLLAMIKVCLRYIGQYATHIMCAYPA